MLPGNLDKMGQKRLKHSSSLLRGVLQVFYTLDDGNKITVND